MKAAKVVRKAIFGTYTFKEIKDKERMVFLCNIDEKYGDFVITHAFEDKGDGVFYFVVGLYDISDGHMVPLFIGTNIGYTPKELVNEMARVIEEAAK